MLAQRESNHVDPAAERAAIELDPARVIGDHPLHSWPGERQEPADVGRRHEVPGRPQDVGAENATGLERTLDIRAERFAREAQPDGPFRGLVLLGLYGAQPANHVLGSPQSGVRNALLEQSSPGDSGCGVHPRSALV